MYRNATQVHSDSAIEWTESFVLPALVSHIWILPLVKKGTSGGNKDVRKGTAPFYCKKHESNVCQLQLVHISSRTRRTTATSQHFSLLDEL